MGGDEAAQEENPKAGKEGGEAAPEASNDDNFIFEDEDGNQIDLGALKDFKGDINDPEAVEAALQ